MFPSFMALGKSPNSLVLLLILTHVQKHIYMHIYAHTSYTPTPLRTKPSFTWWNGDNRKPLSLLLSMWCLRPLHPGPWPKPSTIVLGFLVPIALLLQPPGRPFLHPYQPCPGHVHPGPPLLSSPSPILNFPSHHKSIFIWVKHGQLFTVKLLQDPPPHWLPFSIHVMVCDLNQHLHN